MKELDWWPWFWSQIYVKVSFEPCSILLAATYMYHQWRKWKPECFQRTPLPQWFKHRLTPVLKTLFHKCVISYTCSQSNSGPSGLNWLQVYNNWASSWDFQQCGMCVYQQNLRSACAYAQSDQWVFYDC